MSFNRGVKRNSFGNRNFNGGGGGGGGGGGNPSGRNNMGSGVMGGSLGGSSGGGGGGGVNPWESGMMPGRGLLPTPNNNLSLSSPQAQLVIASNLLSNLLRTQQETQPQVPSLLSLGNTLNGPGPTFGGQQNFGPSRFNDRSMRHTMKNQRSQPYNKMGNRARDGVAGRRGPSAQQSRAPLSGNQRINGNQNQHRNDKTSKPNPASKQNQTSKKEQQEVKTSDKEKAETHVAKSDESEGNKEKKRDWKDEKKEGEVSQLENVETDANESTTETTEKPTSTEKKTEDGQGGGKKSATRHAESRYAAVPMNHMFCHVCNKHMWDGFSFENHLRGRAHQLMMDKLDESYKLKVDLMRHELRVAEEQRELTLTNSKRRGKKVSVDLNVREYCTMCDLNFFGTLSSHRKSDKHQQLKTFLHPRCFPCMKEFPSRIEYDEHCLTPGHMKSSAQSEEQRKNKKKDKLPKGESEVYTAEDEDKDQSGPEIKTTEKDEVLPENTEYIVDLTEGMTIKENQRVPSPKYCRQNRISVGKSMVKEVQGWHCEKCRRFMHTEADMAAHLRNMMHYKNFVQEVKALLPTARETEPQAAVEEVSNEKNETKEEEDDDYEGDWKRRKVDHSKDPEDAPIKDESPEVAADDVIVDKKTDGDDKYDPLEADADSEAESATHDKSVAENPETSVVEDTDKDTPVEKMWADIDNDNDPEIGNLIDDDVEEKYSSQESEVKQPEPEKQPEPPTPEVVQIIEKTPVVALPVVKPPVASVNTPQNKSPRGRGYGRGRGGQRARRSRR